MREEITIKVLNSILRKSRKTTVTDQVKQVVKN